MTSLTAITGARIFTGSEFLDDHAVIIDGEIIKAVRPVTDLHPDMKRHPLAGGILAPGFIDIQVNGGGGALLNADATLDGVTRIATAHRLFGTTGLLPTVITDKTEVIDAAIGAVRAARQAHVPGILGIHIEGPFIDPVRRGAHPQPFIRQMDASDLDMLAQADCGRILLTLSPAHVAPDMIKTLTELGIIVSLGHSDASYEQAKTALAQGARGFTHLFNAMSQMIGRAPGMVGAALDSDAYCGFIADGHHVHPANLHIAFSAKQASRMCLVSDAMPTAAGGPDSFTLQGRKVTRRHGKLTLSDGTLAGSDLTMADALRYVVQVLGISLSDALRMASASPAAFIGLDDIYGKIDAGYYADLVHLDINLRVKATWIHGSVLSMGE